jgi:HK97 family phage portal protein
VKLTTRVAALLAKASTYLSPVTGYSWGWWPRIHESFTGAWQQNVIVDRAAVSAYWAIFSCVTLIASDISKLPAVVMQWSATLKIWEPTLNRPVLRKPNSYQTRIEFFFSWVVSLLLNGNTYVLKRRDPQTGFVIALYILDPCRVTPLVAEDGSIYYQLSPDNLTSLGESITVPASEIIHDRMYTLYHPLIGVSPIYACGVAAMQGLAIQDNSSKFFQNMSRPSGVLTAPGAISDETAARLKVNWETNFGGSNIGRVAVLGDGLKYDTMSINAVDSQLIEQLKMTAEMVCACFHVPAYKIGVGQMPTVNNTAALNQQYYDQCLQFIIEKMELRLDEGLEISFPQETWMDTKPLLRMDPATRLDAHSKAIGGGWLMPNEARQEEDRAPVEGGDTPYLQQQNYSLGALSRRDAKDAQGETDVQAAAMNGAQVTSLQGLIVAAANGAIPVETAQAAIAAAFPLLTPAQVDAMIAPLENFEVEPPPAAPAPPAAQSAPAEEEQTLSIDDLRKELEDACYA